MTISIGSTVLCAGMSRNSTGSPVGPANFRWAEAPGVVKRDYVGAERTAAERIQADSGVITFDVTRTFASVDAALAYIVASKSENVAGVLTFDSTAILPNAAVTNRTLVHRGCSVTISYTIEG